MTFLSQELLHKCRVGHVNCAKCPEAARPYWPVPRSAMHLRERAHLNTWAGDSQFGLCQSQGCWLGLGKGSFFSAGLV